MSSKKIAKTNAARLLERLEIPFTLHQADVDESDLSAVTMAWQYVGQLVFNLLVLTGLVKGADRIVKEMFGL